MVAQPGDTFSVIWFSGRGECGVVFENVAVSDASTVSTMHTAIDRYIVCRGLTGFVDPIKLAMSLTLSEGKLNNFIMMTDGCDNQFNKQDILAAASQLKTKYESVSFIEYGYYADRDMLAQMAQVNNGVVLFAEGTEKYEDAINIAVTGVSRVPQVEVKVNKKATHVLYIQGSQIRIVAVENGVVSVPEDTPRVFSVTPGESFTRLADDHLYLVLYYAIKMGNAAVAWKALEALGDVALVKAYENAFTKQELSVVEEKVQAAVFDVTLRWVEGRSDSCVPNKNAKTVLDVLVTLANSDAKLVLDSPYWSYNKISKGSVAKEDSVLPRFVKSPMSNVSLRGLVFNSTRPNVSIGTTVNGVVELPDNEFGLKSVQSHIHRNYAIIKDGTKNVTHIPVIVENSVLPNLDGVKALFIDGDGEKSYIAIELQDVPVINRARIESVSMQEYVNTIVNLEHYKAALKVVNGLIKEQGGSDAKIQGMIEKYGEAQAAWLSSIGVRDYGFSPVGQVAKEATDEYMALELDYKIKGMSSLPSLDAVRKKVSEKKKLNVADGLIAKNLEQYSPMSKEMLESTKVLLTEQKRRTEVILADMNYTLIIGRVWFGDEDVIDAVVTFADVETTLSIEKTRKVVKI
jgi:hypothetical protein